MFIDVVCIESLSSTNYVIGSERPGMAAVIDPVRDVDRYTTIAAGLG